MSAMPFRSRGDRPDVSTPFFSYAAKVRATRTPQAIRRGIARMIATQVVLQTLLFALFRGGNGFGEWALRVAFSIILTLNYILIRVMLRRREDEKLHAADALAEDPDPRR